MQLLSRAGDLALSPASPAAGNRRSRVHLKLLPRPAAIGCGFNRSTQHIDYRATTPHITIRPAEAGRNVIAQYGLAPVQLATGTMPESAVAGARFGSFRRRVRLVNPATRPTD